MSAFSELLRQWRKTRRFSQLDLALEAEVSARHISFLETGRAQPSRAMVLQLGEALSAPLDVRNLMLKAVGYTSEYAASDWDAVDMAPIRQAIQWTLERHAPYPGFALDRCWTIAAMNAPARTLFGAFGAEVGTSLLDLILSPVAQAAIENWPEVAYHTARRLRSESAAVGGIEALEHAANQLVRHGAVHPVHSPTVPTVFRMGAQRLSLFGTIAQFSTTADETVDDLKIELFFPSDEDSAEFLQNL